MVPPSYAESRHAETSAPPFVALTEEFMELEPRAK